MMKNITEILQNSSLSRIVQRASTLNELNFKIKNLLPAQYRSLYRIVNLVDNQLMIDVQNATVRQGLLLQQNELLKLLQTDFPQIEQLQIKVNPNLNYLS